MTVEKEPAVGMKHPPRGHPSPPGEAEPRRQRSLFPLPGEKRAGVRAFGPGDTLAPEVLEEAP